MHFRLAHGAPCAIFLSVLAGCHAQSSAPPAAPPMAAAAAAPVATTAAEVAEPTKFCSTPERHQFDFWIGEWDVVMRSHPGDDLTKEWVTSHGINRIRKRFDGCVIEEVFTSSDGPDGPWNGISISQWVPRENTWRQTWTDNQGSYLLHYGGMEDGKMILYSPPRTRDGVTTQKRMVFFDIAKDSMNWRWEGTKDGGRTWTSEITMRYARRR
ncbi:DUF1579 family protein [Pendulispora albinea]|uniref:DUF1579 domain-containing protein n=1 Tax=Pendulispora albinea TaxID=2741071 RepID=A0ABZ2LRS3_9BACT